MAIYSNAYKRLILYIAENKKVAAPCSSISRKSCDKNAPCYKENWCYYAKFERLYKHVKTCLERNYNKTKDKKFVSEVDAYIKRKKPKYFRIHNCGDFYSLEYLNKWITIAELNPKTVFVAYTYQTKAVKDMPLPKNLKISLSVKSIYDNKIDKATIDFFKSFLKDHKHANITFVSKTNTNCPAQKDKSKKCFRDCFKCAGKGNIIVFKKH